MLSWRFYRDYKALNQLFWGSCQRRCGFEVKIGNIAGQEVDFFAQKPDKTLFVQVAATMLAQETQERELRPLRAIPDHYEKLVLSMDRAPLNDFDGIQNRNLIDFLLE